MMSDSTSIKLVQTIGGPPHLLLKCQNKAALYPRFEFSCGVYVCYPAHDNVLPLGVILFGFLFEGWGGVVVFFVCLFFLWTNFFISLPCNEE